MHFISQLSFQIKAFTINAEAAEFLTRIVTEAQTTNRSLPFLGGSTLRMCSWVPSSLDVDIPSCPIVWDGNQAALNSSGGNSLHTSSTSLATPVVATPRVSSSSSVTSIAAKVTSAHTSTIGAQQTVTVFVPPPPQPTVTATATVINDSFDVPLNKDLKDEGGNAHNTVCFFYTLYPARNLIWSGSSIRVMFELSLI